MNKKGFPMRPLSPVFDPAIQAMTKRLEPGQEINAARRPTAIDRPKAPSTPAGGNGQDTYRNTALHVAKNCLNGGEI